MKKIISNNKILIIFFIGIFCGIIITNARSGSNNLTGANKDTLTSTKWNQFVSTLDTAIGRSGPDSLTAGSGDKLTTTKWNALVTKLNTYTSVSTCTNDNNGNCNINVATKTLLDPNLLSANIKNGVSIFGVNGSMAGGGHCYTSTNACGGGYTNITSYNFCNRDGNCRSDAGCTSRVPMNVCCNGSPPYTYTMLYNYGGPGGQCYTLTCSSGFSALNSQIFEVGYDSAHEGIFMGFLTCVHY